MAERRMFAKTIVDSDAFLDMPLSTQALYFHLNMRADDDGFINNPKRIMKLIGCSDDDMKILIMKSFVICFESGVIVIKHWKINNYLRNDRYKPTVYSDEKNKLIENENKSYSMQKKDMVYQMDTKGIPSIGKDSIGKDSLDKCREKETYVSIVSRYTQNLALSNSLKDFVEMRKKMKGFTTRALELALNNLDKLASDDETKILIVNQTIENSWKSFYPLKNNNKSKISELPSWYENQDLMQAEVLVDDDELKRLQEALK